jgi:hypothetical protein
LEAGVRYPDGQAVQVGDIVSFEGDRGVVVGSNDSGIFLPPYQAEDWAELGTGIVIRTDEGAWVHFEDDSLLDEMSFVLERRG